MEELAGEALRALAELSRLGLVSWLSLDLYKSTFVQALGLHTRGHLCKQVVSLGSINVLIIFHCLGFSMKMSHIFQVVQINGKARFSKLNKTVTLNHSYSVRRHHNLAGFLKHTPSPYYW